MMFLYIFFISLIVMKTSSLVSSKKFFNLKKNSPFECGFDPISSARIPFSLQFYLIMVIFLIFDVELVLLIPMIKTMQFSNMLNWIITSIILILILLLGIYFEWMQGLLNWSI